MSAKKEKPKVYEITTLERLLNVANVENFERLSIDLLLWLHQYVTIIENVRKKHPEVCEGKNNTELIESSFTWTDDGKQGINSVELINKETGERKPLKKRK